MSQRYVPAPMVLSRGRGEALIAVSSCGCVFCDINLKPIKLRRQWVHHIRREGRFVVCPIKGIKPMDKDRKSGSSDPER